MYVFVGLAFCRERHLSYSLITRTHSYGKQINVWEVAKHPSLELLDPHASHANLSGFRSLILNSGVSKHVRRIMEGYFQYLRVCCVAIVHKATAVNRIEQEKKKNDLPNNPRLL